MICAGIEEGGFGGPGGFPGGPGGMDGGNTDKGDHSTKGIKAANEIVITDGTISIKSYDDAIHANNDTALENGSSPLGNVTIAGGNITVYSNDDGIHADGLLCIQGGTSDGIDSNSRAANVGIVFTGGYTVVISNSGILMDNAIKYCDPDGCITVTLQHQRRTILTIENTYCAVEQLELPRLFDRFYRADKARTFTGGYGIGLSMAKSIAEKHGGEITAYKKDDECIGFKITL